jgi:hypothetical protein
MRRHQAFALAPVYGECVQRKLPRAAIRHECREGPAKPRDEDPRLLRAATDTRRTRALHRVADHTYRAPEHREVDAAQALENLLTGTLTRQGPRGHALPQMRRVR